MKALASLLFEISCTQDFQILFSKGHNSKRGITWLYKKYIEDIYFFEVNTKYISSSELKTSKFSRVRSTSENLDVFKSRVEIYLVFTDKK